jgi:putative N-acetylmannosamine-6-phosphate epimerase
MLVEILTGLCWAVYRSEQVRLRAFLAVAEQIVASEADNLGFIDVARDRRPRANRLESFAGYLRQEVEADLQEGRDIQTIAKFCADMIGGIIRGLSTDRMSADGRRTRVVREVDCLGEMRRADPKAIVRAAFRALGYKKPPLFKAEDVARFRKRPNRNRT